MGIEEEIVSWGNSPETFRPLVELEFPRARGEGIERVVVYEVVTPKVDSN